jgi:hypothetical protein
MASTSTPAYPRFDGGVAPTEANDPFTDLEEALARLIHADYAPEARAGASAPDMSAGARLSPSFEATLGPADPHGAVRPRDRVSLSRRGVLAHVMIAVCLGASAIWAWRSYGGPSAGQATAPPAIDTAAPPPAQSAASAQRATTAENKQGAASGELGQIDTTARDLAALRRTVAQLAAGQEQLTRELAKLQADKPPVEKPDERMLRRVSASPAPPLAAPVRKPAAKTPVSPHAARRLSPSVHSPPQPVPQIPPQLQLSALPLLRPPMPVPQP